MWEDGGGVGKEGEWGGQEGVFTFYSGRGKKVIYLFVTKGEIFHPQSSYQTA